MVKRERNWFRASTERERERDRKIDMFWFPKVLRSHFSFVPLKAFLLLIQADDSSFEKLNFFSIGRVFPQKRKAKSKSTNYRENFIVLGPKNSLFIGESRIGEKSSSGNGNRCREKNVSWSKRGLGTQSNGRCLAFDCNCLHCKARAREKADN